MGLFWKLAVVVGAVLAAIIYYHPGAQYDYISYLPGIIDYYSSEIAPRPAIVWKRDEHPKPESIIKRPNIVLIIADDLGFNDLAGGAGALTPHIDSIKDDGISFSEAYAGHATCSPARASLLTGRYPNRFGFETLAVSPVLSWTISRPDSRVARQPVFYYDKLRDMPKHMSIPTSEILLPQKLHEMNYSSVYVGKWHLGTNLGMRPHDRFQETLSFDGAASMYSWPVNQPNVVNERLEDPLDAFFFNNLFDFMQFNGGTRFHIGEYMTDYLAKQAASAIRTKLTLPSTRDRSVPPLFLTVAFNAPHTPLQAKKEDYDSLELAHLSHKEKVYGAMIKALDRGVGLILDALRETGQEDNTLVIFTSDNGGPSYVGIPHMNHPLRGWKATFFEGGFRVPFYMRWPAAFGPQGRGLVYNRPVSHVDIFATAAAAAGVDIESLRASRVYDGVDLLPYVLVQQQQLKLAEECSGVEDQQQCVVGDIEQKYLQDPHESLFWRTGSYTVLRQGKWKLQATLLPDRVWLTDLPADISERVNLAQGLTWTTFRAILQEHNHTDDATAHGACLQALRSHVNEIGAASMASSLQSPEVQASLCTVGRRLLQVDAEQAPPLWPALTEIPMGLDLAHAGIRSADEEYVYWAV